MYGYELTLAVQESVARELPTDLFALNMETDQVSNGIAFIRRSLSDTGPQTANQIEQIIQRIENLAKEQDFAYKLWIVGDEASHVEYYFHFTGDEAKDVLVEKCKIVWRFECGI